MSVVRRQGPVGGLASATHLKLPRNFYSQILALPITIAIINTIVMCWSPLFYSASTLLGYHHGAIEHPHRVGTSSGGTGCNARRWPWAG